MKSAGDLCTLAMGNESTWEKVKCNVRHILASVLHGMEYLHSKFYQHCDLKGIAIELFAEIYRLSQFPSKTVTGTDKLQNARSEMCPDILTTITHN